MFATWNIYLVNRNEKPLLYHANLNELETIAWSMRSLEKAFDGSDADGILILRSDYDPKEV